MKRTFLLAIGDPLSSADRRKLCDLMGTEGALSIVEIEG